MFHRFRSRDAQDGDPEMVGIVVRSPRLSDGETRTISFAWGTEERPFASLPFGRWKTAARAA
jgi:hypothetical protein